MAEPAQSNFPWKIVGAVVVGVGLLAFAGNDFELPASFGGELQPEVTTDAYSFLGEYRTSDVTADVKYKGRVVRLTGAVGNAPLREGGHVYVAATTTLDPRRASDLEVRCELPSKQEKAIVDFAPGSHVTMTGKVGSFEMSLVEAYVRLEGCVFQVTRKASPEPKQALYDDKGNEVLFPVERVGEAYRTGRFGFAPKQAITTLARQKYMVIQAEQAEQFFTVGLGR